MSNDLAFAGVRSAFRNGVDATETERPGLAGMRARAPLPFAEAVTVEVATGEQLSGLQSDWKDLNTRADSANIFMNPSLVRLAGEHYPGRRSFALLAWQDAGAGTRRLVGVWAFAVGRAARSPIPMSVLTSPPMPNAYLSTPVIDRDCLDSVIDAMLAQIADDTSLPKIVALDAMGADTDTMRALQRGLAARESAARIFSETQRPKLASNQDGKAYLEQSLSSSSRKKLRQNRRRLAERGALQSAIQTDADEIRRTFEEFLKLEAAGWKGRRGTALQSDAQYARGMIAALAAHGDVSIHALTLDAKPVSLQIVLRAGPAAFTWKTAYDEALHQVSPGMLLLEDYTGALLADEGVDYVDSCAIDDSGYMAAWTERAAISQFWFDARRGRSPTFTLLSQLQASYLALRARAKTAYHKYKPKKAR